MTSAQMLETIQPIAGWMVEEELEWLFEQAKSRRLILELGTWLGRSAKAMALATPGVLFCVDNWEGGPSDSAAFASVLSQPDGKCLARSTCMRNLGDEITHGKVLLLELDLARPYSRGLLQTMFEHSKPDMIFIDADHSPPSVRRDVELAKSISGPQTLICGHDFCRPEVQAAVEFVLATSPYKLAAGPHQIWYAEHY